MRTRSDLRGYSLLSVLVAGVIIMSAGAVLLVTSRETTLLAIQQQRGTSALAVAQAGLVWAEAKLNSREGRDIILKAVADDTPKDFQGVRIRPWKPAEPFGGVPAGPPAPKVSNEHWTAFGDGHFAVFGALDPTAPERSAIVRVLGQVGTKAGRSSQAVLETNIVVNIVKEVPSGFTACIDQNLEISFYDQQGPYDFTGNMRFDGGLGVPLAMSTEHNRVNGLARQTPNSAIGETSSYLGGNRRQWRGLQRLRSGADDDQRFGYAAGPWRHVAQNTPPLPAGWLDGNRYIGNDPRIVDRFESGATPTTAGRGYRLGPGGMLFSGSLVTDGAVTSPRGAPLIAFLSAADDSKAMTTVGGLLGDDKWDGKGDNRSRKGFYGCDNHGGGGDYLNKPTEVCVKGSAGNNDPNFKHAALNHSGRAWGILQSIFRQCTGSGDSINPYNGTPWWHPTRNPNGIRCAAGFEWLENVAACLILPRNMVVKNGTNHRRDIYSDSINGNNFAGCHPGCLLAQGPAAGSLSRPFLSVCINLDAANAHTYGPGAFPSKVVSGGTRMPTSTGLPRTANTQPVHPPTLNYSATCSAVAPFTCPPSDHPVTPKLPPVTGVGGRTKAEIHAERLLDATVNPPLAPTHITDNDHGMDNWRQWNLVTNSVDLGAAGVAPQFRGADGITRRGGAVTERGNPSFIARLDLTDRGPLGTCEQNCLAYGFGRDRTYGAHRTDIANPGGSIGTGDDRGCHAVVPAPGATYAVDPYRFDQAPPTTAKVLCNVDYDQDGRLDRKSFAFANSYRERCADPRDGIPYAIAFNIHPDNTALADPGCLNDMPNFHPNTVPIRITPFCSDGSRQDLVDSIEELSNIADVVTTANFNDKNTLEAGKNHLGGAKCHMGASSPGNVPHPHTGALAGIPDDDTDHLGRADYWIEDECPDPVVARINGKANINVGLLCGCGILIFDENALHFKGGRSHFLWRGILVWNLKNQVNDVLKLDKDGQSTFIVEGAVLALTSNNRSFKIKITKQVSDATVVQDSAQYKALPHDSKNALKMLFRFNHAAINDAFAGAAQPLKLMRRVR